MIDDQVGEIARLLAGPDDDDPFGPVGSIDHGRQLSREPSNEDPAPEDQRAADQDLARADVPIEEGGVDRQSGSAPDDGDEQTGDLLGRRRLPCGTPCRSSLMLMLADGGGGNFRNFMLDASAPGCWFS